MLVLFISLSLSYVDELKGHSLYDKVLIGLAQKEGHHNLMRASKRVVHDQETM